MSERESVGIFGAPTGRRLDQGPGQRSSTVYGLTPADQCRLKVARENFIEADADDFDRNGKDRIGRATGKRYRLVRSDPTLGDDPRDSGIELFVVSDGWLVYLRPVGAIGRSRTVTLGSVGAVRA